MTHFPPRLAASGTATLVLGAVVVNYAGVTANTLILLTPQAGTLNLGGVSVSVRTAGVSFTVISTNPLDARVVAWFAFEP